MSDRISSGNRSRLSCIIESTDEPADSASNEERVGPRYVYEENPDPNATHAVLDYGARREASNPEINRARYTRVPRRTTRRESVQGHASGETSAAEGLRRSRDPLADHVLIDIDPVRGTRVVKDDEHSDESPAESVTISLGTERVRDLLQEDLRPVTLLRRLCDRLLDFYGASLENLSEILSTERNLFCTAVVIFVMAFVVLITGLALDTGVTGKVYSSLAALALVLTASIITALICLRTFPQCCRRYDGRNSPRRDV
ncbi:hypothetical protein CDAR_19311 [Caerostris darwini]|uniref:Transmembrane protein n=1 Tax=Caerostris darwini TaxID=1538125 RepID=A0AAV4WDC8_9ARAC|nr:hypothetical protein CDAR_19311 [Caerostris darwini]